MTVFEIMKFGSNLLKENKIPSHILDAELLLSKVLKKSREEILINLNLDINKKSVSKYKEYLKRRSRNEPVAYILGEKEFWSKKFSITKNALIPRPETELLVEKLIQIYENKKIIILDIGTGSGCIILSLLSNLENSTGIGVDISNGSISLAKKNAIIHKLSHRTKFFGKSFEKVFNKKFDLIVSNPPYIEAKDIKNLSDDIKKYEPRTALDGGNDGLDLIRKIIYKSKRILKINGMLALEIGNEQYKKVSKILVNNNFRVKHVIKDYKNNIRCVLAEYN